jgi:hypothetical protein
MTVARIKQYPDSSGCDHRGVGLSSPTRRTGNFEVGYCSDCKFSIGFRLDKNGARTGETQIIQIEEVIEEKPKTT